MSSHWPQLFVRRRISCTFHLNGEFAKAKITTCLPPTRAGAQGQDTRAQAQNSRRIKRQTDTIAIEIGEGYMMRDLVGGLRKEGDEDNV